MTQLLQIILNIVTSVFEFCIDIFCEIGVAVIPAKRKQNYNADFGKAVEILDTDGAGFQVCTWSTSMKASNSHAICIGATGSHKSTSTCFIQLLKAHTGSYVIHDCTREIFTATAPALAQAGYIIKVLDYTSENSEAFNFLAKCKTIIDVEKGIATIFSNNIAGHPDYWTQSAEAITCFFAKVLWRHADKQFVHMASVLNMLHVFSFGAEEFIDAWIVRHCTLQEINEYKSFCSTPPNTMQSTLSTAKTVLSIYANENIQRLSSFDTISFQDFRSSKVALFLCSSPGTAHHFRSISASFITSFFNHILDHLPAQNDLNITFLLDESSLLKIPLSSFLSLSRKFKVSVLTLWQDYNQIEHLYGKFEASNIFSNSALKIFMPGFKPLDTCMMLEKLLGRYSVLDEDGSTQRTLDLLSAQEIYQLNKILVLNGHNKPILLPVVPYFKQRSLNKLLQLPASNTTTKLPTGQPPILQFTS
jgi:type IV secretory pathway TraG/TraD family ATPase VirD4